MQRGLSIVVWRGRHVVEPTELGDTEAAAYGREVLAVGRALHDAFAPVKLNYNVLGNSVPHLHTHIVPRYADDPRPGWPFPFPDPEPGRSPGSAWSGTWHCCAVCLQTEGSSVAGSDPATEVQRLTHSRFGV